MYGRALQISNSEPVQLCYPTWGEETVDISGITDVTVVGGGVMSFIGYLPMLDGSYHPYAQEEYEKIQQTYDQWPNTKNTALADTCGWSNTEALIAKQTDADYMGPNTKAFRNDDSVNQGFSDWFIPSAGQLAYIYMKHDKINTLLQKVTGATQISTYDYYWSSSEHSVDTAWYVCFDTG